MLNPKTKTTHRFEFDRNKHPIQDYRSMYQEFNQAGFPTLEIEYGPDGEELFRQASDFLENGELRWKRQILGDESLNEEEEHFFDEEGRKQKSLFRFGEDHHTLKLYRYHPNGLLTDVELQDEDGKVEGWEEILCDEAGKVVEWAVFNADEKVEGRELRSYDPDGNLILETKKGFENEFLEEWSYEYDESGNMVKKELRGETGAILQSQQHDYGEQGHIKKITENHGESAETIENYFQYDAQGREILMEGYLNGVFLHRVERVYGDHGYPVVQTETDVDSGMLIETHFSYTFWEG